MKHATAALMSANYGAKLALIIVVIIVTIIAVVGSICALISLTNNNPHLNSQFKSFQHILFVSTINNCLNSSDDMTPPAVSFGCDRDSDNYETQLKHTIVSCFQFCLLLDF